MNTNLKYRIGFGTLGALSSYGSIIIVKPCKYVDNKVAKWATATNGDKSDMSVNSKVLIIELNLSVQNLKKI